MFHNFYKLILNEIYMSEKELSDKVKKLNLEFKIFEVPSWSTFKPEVAIKDGIEYNKKIGSNIIYMNNGEDFVCLDCDSEILAIEVAHPIHDGPFPMSGSGKCEYEQVPYCPTCEEKPNYNGSPISEKRIQNLQC